MQGFIYDTPIWVLMLLATAISFLGFVVGDRWAHKTLSSGRITKEQILEIIPNSLLGLLALLLAFTLSMSISRFEARKQLMLKEANAIGTTYLRAGMLQPEAGAQVRGLLKDYTDHRLQYYAHTYDTQDIANYHLKTDGFLSQLWGVTTQAVLKEKLVVHNLLITSLNELIDLEAERRHATRDRVPDIIYYIIFMIMFVSLCALGFVYGSRGIKSQAGLILALLFSLVLGLIMDLDRPRRGLIRVPQTSLMELSQSFSK